MSQLQNVLSTACRQLPGTVFRINIPANTTINLLNLVELTSPSGICLILRLPFLAGECGDKCDSKSYEGLLNTIRQAGGTVEVLNQ